jgi:hypothetical protein
VATERLVANSGPISAATRERELQQHSNEHAHGRPWSDNGTAREGSPPGNQSASAPSTSLALTICRPSSADA